MNSSTKAGATQLIFSTMAHDTIPVSVLSCITGWRTHCQSALLHSVTFVPRTIGQRTRMLFARLHILSPSSLTLIVRSSASGTLRRMLRLALGHLILMQRLLILSDATFSVIKYGSSHNKPRANKMLHLTADHILC
jgi:hypothetical protein